jgi:Xaa-Pro aminopeptidase
MTGIPLKRLVYPAAVYIFLCAALFGQSPGELKARRDKVFSQMPSNSVMILQSRGSHTTFLTESQDGNFFYLTGIDESNAFLVLSKMSEPWERPSSGTAEPEGGRTIVFSLPVNERRADWDAQPLGMEGIEKLGFEDVRPSSEFEDFFDRLLLRDIDVLYMDIARSRTVWSPLTEDEQIIQRAREKGADFKLVSPGEILTAMGRTRSASEIELIRRAVDITAEAHLAAMHAIQSGMLEYQLQAIVESVFVLNGSRRAAFPSIIGSGVNSCILHWMRNTKTMEAGEVVVVDMGATWEHYPADITRTYPVSGKFSPRQREVYEIVLAANEAAIAMVAPGVDHQEISQKAADIVGEGLVSLGLIQDKSEYRKYYFHGLSHHLGMRVGRSTPLDKLEPGMVLTIEPGIYIREEKIGVRIEDDVLVTKTGHEVLSRQVPKTISDIEKIMKDKGPDFTPYLLKKITR